jgi:hypothetical protein
MIDLNVWSEIPARARRGEANQQRVRELGIERQTVRRLRAHVRPAPSQRLVTRPPLVAPSLASIQRRGGRVDAHADRIFQERQRQGYPGGDEMVTRAREATVRFETPPATTPQWTGGVRGGGWPGSARTCRSW